MARSKCCVLGCESTSDNYRLFCMPMNDNLRNLWMSFLVPVNPHLLGLTKGQLMTKRVCQKHFDKTQFSQGSRIRYSYPCLFTEKEFFHGVPLSAEEYSVLNEHNYCANREQIEDTPAEEPATLMGMSDDVHLQEHLYAFPPTSQVAKDGVDVSLEEHQHPASASIEQSPAVPAIPGIESDVPLQGHQQPVPVPMVQSKTDADIHCTQADVSLQEHHQPVPVPMVQSTTDADTHCIQGPSYTRKPLVDISHQFNIEVTSKLYEIPIPEVHHAAEISFEKTDIRTNKNTTLPHMSKQLTSKDTSTVRKFSAKTRRFIKQTKEIAADSIGQSATERLQNAHQLASQDIMKNFESLNKKAKAFLLMQLRLARKNKMSRRFTFQEKLFALALMKQSPKGYKLLKNIFALPTKRTLTRLSQNIVFECGINKTVFDHIKHSTKNWDTKKRLCSLVFDEVALTPHVVYNESKDHIIGFEEIAGERRQQFTDHALVFMARGICSSWRQSIAYYFCSGTVSAPDLERILKEIIPKLSEAGLIPLALVCDQGSTFRGCFNNLKATTNRLQTPIKKPYDTVHVAGHDLFLFHDPPHLLKSIRNNFLNKDIEFENKTASWKDILYVYDTDMQGGHTRALPRLTAYHVDPKKVKKMKVKMAAQVLSARTAAMLKFTDSAYKRVNMPLETMEATAELVLFFDELFDSVNGSPGQGRGKLRCAVKENSPQIEFWRTAIRKIKNIKFIDCNSKLAKRAGKPRHVRPPCLNGWITTLNSFIGLTETLFSTDNVEYFYPRFINQDPLENFFGRIRAANYRNVNPDCNTFIYSFKSIVLSNILTPHSTSMNCEDDDGETLIHLSNLFSSENEKSPISWNMPSSSSLTSSNQAVESIPITRESVTLERIRVQTSAYTAGYICRRLTKKVECHDCSKTYTTEENQGIHKYIQFREYKLLKHKNLKYPNARMVCLYRECASTIHDYLNIYSHKHNVKKNLKRLFLKRCDMSWLGCKKQCTILNNFFMHLIIRLQVHNWCNTINRILQGKIPEKYVLKMHSLQKAALNKYKVHRLRQKATKDHE